MNPIARSLKNMKERIPEQELKIIGLSIAVGIIGGFGAVFFRYTITWVQLFFTTFFDLLSLLHNPVAIVLTPTIGGLIVGYMVYKWAPEAKGHGVPEIIYSVNLEKARMRLRAPIVKIIASAITIGTGGSAGREGPIAQIGGGFAAYVAEKSKLSPEDSKILVMAGVASGIATIFNAPLGGVLFAIELIPRDKKSRSVFPLIIASVIGTSIGRNFIGDEYAYSFPSSITISGEQIFSNLGLFILIGALTGVLSVMWIRGFYFIEDIFDSLPIHPAFIAAIGGLFVGLIEIYYPEVDGTTNVAVNDAFSGKVLLQTAAILLVMKFLATSSSIGSGGSGGIFAPTFFMGTMFGTIFGYVLYNMGYTGLSIAFFGMLAMAGLFAGSARAPLTAIIMTSEMVGDFNLFLPLMFVVITAWVISRYLLTSDIYVVKLERRGVKFPGQDDILDEMKVHDVMVTDVITVSPKDRIEAVMKLMRETHHTGFPVVFEGELVGVITEHDIDRVLDQLDMREWIVDNVCTKKIITTYSECPLSLAFLKMQELHINRLPVVDSKGSHKLIGWLTRSDIMRAYRNKKTYLKSIEEEDKLFAKIEAIEAAKKERLLEAEQNAK